MVSRRQVIQGLGALGIAGSGPALAAGACPPAKLSSRFCFEEPPFTLGVASGDPTHRSVILWTRLAPDPLHARGLGGLDADRIAVQWAVAQDPDMRRVVRQGEAQARAETGYAVHVDVDGLAPGRHYWYRFASQGRASRIGRTRTAPERARALRIACVSCQDFVARYGAYANLARERLDLVVHLGDSIYEWAVDGIPARTLPVFRNKHALFRGDPQARDAWAAHPFMVTWDDHEVANNYYGTDPQLDPLRAMGYQAFYEHMPLRLPEGPPERWHALRVYRGGTFGGLLELALLDLRQYRDAPPPDRAAAERPGRTVLGDAQRRWLLDRIAQSSAAWLCIGSPVFMGDYAANLDAWDGFAHERWDVLRAVAARRPGRVVVASGDFHRAIASRLVAGRAGPRFEADAPTVAVEFGTPALSSHVTGKERADPDVGFAAKPDAPWILYEDRGYRGYLLCDVTRASWRARYRVLQHGESECMTTLAAFEVTPGDGAPRIASSRFVPFRC